MPAPESSAAPSLRQTSRDLPNLDLLRSFAVLLVLLDHTLLQTGHPLLGPWQSDWIGVFGVYLFFVHTSLVLMSSLQRRPCTTDFYLRRIFRIYPLAICALLAAVALRLASLVPLHSPYIADRFSPLDVLLNLLLLQNLGGHPIFGVMWSLHLEVEMYLLLPFLFFFASNTLARWPILLAWALAAALCRVTFAPAAGNNFFTVVPDFLPGIVAYIGFHRDRPRLPAWLFPLFLLALLTAFMARPGVRSGWFVCLTLGLLLPAFRQVSLPWLTRASHHLAKYSYGIYLGHSFGLILAFQGLPLHTSLGARLTVGLLSTALLAVLAYHLVEKPMIDLGSRLATRFGSPSPATREAIPTAPLTTI